MNLTIFDITEFCAFLSAAVKLSDGHKFIVSPNGITLRCVNDDKTMRGELVFKLATSDAPFTFCINETARFLNTLKLCIPPKNTVSEIVIKYDGEMISHNSKRFKFKFGTASPALINKWTDDSGVNFDSLTLGATAVVKGDDIKRIITAYGILNSEAAKIYLTKQDTTIMADITDGATKLSNIISLPLTESFDGRWVAPYCCKFNSFRVFNIYQLDSINIHIANGTTVVAVSDSTSYTAKLYCSLLKG